MADTPAGGVNIAQLISALAPIFLGSGTQTTTGSPTTNTSAGTSNVSANNSSITSNAIDPATLASLTGIANTATNNANNPGPNTDALVHNILTQSAQAFAPVIAQQNSAGLYNTSTLSLLSSEAQARATAAASAAVLNYQTSQQQIAQSALTTIAGDTKTSATTGNTTQTGNTTNVQNLGPTINTKVTAPSVPISQSLPTLIGGVIANKAIPDGTLSSLTGNIGSSISSGFTSLTDALGITQPAVNFAGGAVPDGALNLAGAQVGPGVAADAGPALTTATNAAPVAAEVGGGADLAGEAGVDVGATIGANAGTDLGLAGAEIGGDVGAGVAGGIGADIAGDAGVDAATGLVASGAADAGLGLAGAEGAADAASFGAFGAAASDAAVTGASVAAGTVAAEGAADVGAAAAGGAAASFGVEDALAAVAAFAGWVVCTELKNQGKMPVIFYRYGLAHYLRYPVWGRRGYLLWGVPLVSYIKKHPSSLTTRIVSSIFNARVRNIAADAGCSSAKWTYYGAICRSVVALSSFTPGLFYLASSVLQSKGKREITNA